jgi:transposase
MHKVPRRRGAQPHNTNARQRLPIVNEAFARLESHRQLVVTGDSSIPAVIHDLVDLTWQLSDASDLVLLNNDSRAFLAILKVIDRVANRVSSLALMEHRRSFQFRTLSACAENASVTLANAWAPRQPKPRCRWHEPYYIPISTSFGNQPTPVVYLPLTIDNSPFVPVFLQNPDTLSTYCGLPDCPVSFLNDRHWHCLRLLIADQVAEDQARAKALAALHPDIKRRASRAVPWPERFLLDGILWKLATACAWQDLPKPYPYRRCQKLYQSLRKSGRMLHIFDILHADLHAYGDADLLDMALNGDYQVFGSRILYIPHGKHTWQGLIALLLLQCTHHANLVYARTHPQPCFEPRLPRLPPLFNDLFESDYIPPIPPPGTLKVPVPINHPVLRTSPLNSRIWRTMSPSGGRSGGVAFQTKQPSPPAKPPRLLHGKSKGTHLISPEEGQPGWVDFYGLPPLVVSGSPDQPNKTLPITGIIENS